MTNFANNKEDVVSIWFNTLVVIVLYKVNLYDSLTFKSLKNSIQSSGISKKIDLLICDNSLKKPVNINCLVKNDDTFSITYLHDLKNPGVSKSYNKAAEIAVKEQKKWLFILDQDTVLPENTIQKYQHAVTRFPNFPIYAPQLYSGALLYSPCRYWFRKGFNLSSISPGVHPMRNKNVLNSGLLIDLAAFCQVGGYDEKVPLYYSDFVFFDRLKKYFTKFIVIDCYVLHQLSSVDYTNINFAIYRFEEYCKGARAASVSNKSNIAYIEYMATVGIRSLLMSYRFKNLKFLRIFINAFK